MLAEQAEADYHEPEMLDAELGVDNNAICRFRCRTGVLAAAGKLVREATWRSHIFIVCHVLTNPGISGVKDFAMEIRHIV